MRRVQKRARLDLVPRRRPPTRTDDLLSPSPLPVATELDYDHDLVRFLRALYDVDIIKWFMDEIVAMALPTSKWSAGEYDRINVPLLTLGDIYRVVRHDAGLSVCFMSSLQRAQAPFTASGMPYLLGDSYDDSDDEEEELTAHNTQLYSLATPKQITGLPVGVVQNRREIARKLVEYRRRTRYQIDMSPGSTNVLVVPEETLKAQIRDISTYATKIIRGEMLRPNPLGSEWMTLSRAFNHLVFDGDHDMDKLAYEALSTRDRAILYETRTVHLMQMDLASVRTNKLVAGALHYNLDFVVSLIVARQGDELLKVAAIFSPFFCGSSEKRINVLKVDVEDQSQPLLDISKTPLIAAVHPSTSDVLGNAIEIEFRCSAPGGVRDDALPLFPKTNLTMYPQRTESLMFHGVVPHLWPGCAKEVIFCRVPSDLIHLDDLEMTTMSILERARKVESDPRAKDILAVADDPDALERECEKERERHCTKVVHFNRISGQIHGKLDQFKEIGIASTPLPPLLSSVEAPDSLLIGSLRELALTNITLQGGHSVLTIYSDKLVSLEIRRVRSHGDNRAAVRVTNNTNLEYMHVSDCHQLNVMDLPGNGAEYDIINVGKVTYVTGSQLKRVFINGSHRVTIARRTEKDGVVPAMAPGSELCINGGIRVTSAVIDSALNWFPVETVKLSMARLGVVTIDTGRLRVGFPLNMGTGAKTVSLVDVYNTSQTLSYCFPHCETFLYSQSIPHSFGEKQMFSFPYMENLKKLTVASFHGAIMMTSRAQAHAMGYNAQPARHCVHAQCFPSVNYTVMDNEAMENLGKFTATVLESYCVGAPPTDEPISMPITRQTIIEKVASCLPVFIANKAPPEFALEIGPLLDMPGALQLIRFEMLVPEACDGQPRSIKVDPGAVDSTKGGIVLTNARYSVTNIETPHDDGTIHAVSVPRRPQLSIEVGGSANPDRAVVL